jgi:hypothetical protein
MKAATAASSSAALTDGGKPLLRSGQSRACWVQHQQFTRRGGTPGSGTKRLCARPSAHSSAAPPSNDQTVNGQGSWFWCSDHVLPMLGRQQARMWHSEVIDG